MYKTHVYIYTCREESDCCSSAVLKARRGEIRTAGLGRQRRLPARLPGHDLGDGVPDDDAGLLDLLLGQPRRDADLEGWVDDQVTVVERAELLHDREALELGDQDPVGQRLYLWLVFSNLSPQPFLA